MLAPVDVAVVILTYNEELNLPFALNSVKGWARELFVLDSGSTDRTVAIAEQMGAHVERRAFDNYPQQRNFALDHLPITAEWVMFLDADEWLTSELKDEIRGVVLRHPTENAFYMKRRTYFMGTWIRRGYYPAWILRLFRHGKARCETRNINEHMVTEGAVGRLENDFVDENRKGLSEWVTKHNRYATLEAAQFIEPGGQVDARFWASQAERTRWIRHHVWWRLPPLLRPIAYFGYRYILRVVFSTVAMRLYFTSCRGSGSKCSSTRNT